MSELAEREDSHEPQTLAQAVSNIFLEAQRSRLIGLERFYDFQNPPEPDALRQAIGNVATERLVEMIRGEVVGEGEGVSEVAQEVSSWTAEAGKFQLHKMALEAYNKSQSEQVHSLLSGKLVTVRSRLGSSNVILPAGIWESTGRPTPNSVSGYSMGADVKTGRLILAKGDFGDREMWAIKMVDYSSSSQPILAVDLEIEE
jgi:hypothetical protein